MESDTIMDVYEPYLLKIGFIQRTPSGRALRRAGYEHLGLEPTDEAGAAEPSAQRSLFDVPDDRYAEAVAGE